MEREPNMFGIRQKCFRIARAHLIAQLRASIARVIARAQFRSPFTKRRRFSKEKVIELQRSKSLLLEDIFDASQSANKKLNLEELKELLE
ncbi:MAG: hypothetical protein WD490_06045 [Opitutales bacterium]